MKYLIGLLALLCCCQFEREPDLEMEEEIGLKTDPGKDISACYPAYYNNELNIATWNIQDFPQDVNTKDLVKTLIADLDADLIAVQEISDTVAFVDLGNGLEMYSAHYSNVRYNLEVGFIYKESAFTSLSESTLLFEGDANAFPRQVVRLDATHVSGLEFTLLIVHLKCCGDGLERRKLASEALKQYIDEELSDQAVIVTGDFNDDLESGTPFENFINDSTNYQFADRHLTEMSYPSWPSHLDHILITDELFHKLRMTEVILPENCINDYSILVSDHRPVLASFR
ncbi:endonuclease/exonuclease/phosphatase family protein [Marinoscillum sp. MHG1-6]|uniref:endonuclease/exonuclease/phosphatase family protein n=1 Tax=Marinoscillum sp. MHG1-6 TaxID=2959627 RepID=UPI002156FA0F|nr:endonuclease/exonuclease/phosphatase family protein [Marinoscillum sp. MHG1-6]